MWSQKLLGFIGIPPCGRASQASSNEPNPCNFKWKAGGTWGAWHLEIKLFYVKPANFIVSSFWVTCYIRVGWKVHRLTKIFSWSLTKWDLFFNIAPLVNANIFQWCCSAWITLVQNIINSRYNIITWAFQPMNISVLLYNFAKVLIFSKWGLLICQWLIKQNTPISKSYINLYI